MTVADEETRNKLIPILNRAERVSAVLERQYKETETSDVACQLLHSYEVMLEIMKVLRECN